ncbi:MAG: lysine--tRNA ligase [Arenicellales bacterium]|jgi:lysyl-tRNA synthetase class 2|nr:lysine--tRNA ligase [Arenicellales bacterium]MDP6791779.1 lysine--tRNA ligase [Arenicellales bacterium]MDP6918568.1 lysine--tRNA ligase [Arenicellales bacterium]|tara:strand:+ start:19998 stop:21500 length:1503 start_codon:yes stop_codon:yes gene_type:complete
MNQKNESGSEQVAQRRAKLKALRESGNAFPNDFRRDAEAAELLAQYNEAESEALESQQIEVHIAGRLMSRRVMGKAGFAHVRDESGDIQIYAQRDALAEGVYNSVFKKLDIGDIVGVSGVLFKTRTGELTVNVRSLRLLVKSLHPLPEKYHGLTDIETRYRRRYLDLLINQESREVFRKRAATVRALRRFLDQRGYLEIESPIMQSIPGGANARPFVTHHHALDVDLYLRVAQELAIKRCLVGGFEKVYELNRNFRNEGLSAQHNPEFTMLEYNEAYVDFVDYMNLTEEMLRQVAGEVTGKTALRYQGEQIDFSRPFARLSMAEAVCQHNGSLSIDHCSDPEALASHARSMGLEVPEGWTAGELLLELFEETVESKLISPTFITGYPAAVSPLSRRQEANPDFTDRFELFVAGRELANGFSELNDPEDQAQRFREQVKSKTQGNQEAMFYDADYVTALEYGLPPNAGGGLGVDRYVMILTDSPSIRDVLLFPHMRPEAAD